MWRKSIHETIGYYDEQFKCVADFDFQIRAALHYPFVKTGEPLGIYLESQPHKLSANGLADMERNIIYLRYGVGRRLNLVLLRPATRRYKQHQILFFDKWYDFTEQAPFGKWYNTAGIIYACFSSSYWLCKWLTKKILIT
jgi:hypothetical protein